MKVVDKCKPIRDRLLALYDNPNATEAQIAVAEAQLARCEDRHGPIPTPITEMATQIDVGLIRAINDVGRGSPWIDRWIDDYCGTVPHPHIPLGPMVDLISELTGFAASLPAESKLPGIILDELGDLLKGVGKRVAAGKPK